MCKIIDITIPLAQEISYAIFSATLLFFNIEFVRCITKVGVIKFYLKRWFAEVQHSSLPSLLVHRI